MNFLRTTGHPSLPTTKATMDTDDYRRNRQAVLDFVRLRKVEGLFAWLRQIGVMLKGGNIPRSRL